VGLLGALRALAASVVEQARTVSVVYDEDVSAAPRLALDVCNHLLRITQEAMSNALRHAAAKELRVRLHVDSEIVRIEVSDDGRGFMPGAGTGRGMGMRAMRDRALAIGARLIVTAGEQAGTTIRCECANRGA
jgi:two-component system sensor histidine kinase UhpB